MRKLRSPIRGWSLVGVVLFACATYYSFQKGLDYFEGGDYPNALSRGVVGLFCLGITVLILMSIGAEARTSRGPHYYKWFADGKPLPESYRVASARDCTPTCTAECLTTAKESAPPGQWQPLMEGDLEFRTSDGITALGYRILPAKQVPFWCGTDLIEVEAQDVGGADGETVVCRTWREIKRFKWTCEDMIAYAKWCAEDAANTRATDWTTTAVMARAIRTADLGALCDAIGQSLFQTFVRARSAVADAEVADAGASRHAVQAAAYARQATSATNAVAAARATRDTALEAVYATYEASGGDSVIPYGSRWSQICDSVSARQRKWIEERIGAKLKD